MVGYWPSSLFALFVSIHKLAKKEQGQYPAILTKQTWSIKDLLYGFWFNFSCGTFHLARSGSQSQDRFSFILPAQGANHIIILFIITIIIISWLPSFPPQIVLYSCHTAA